MLIEAAQEDGVRAFEVFSQPPTAANLRAYERSMEAANWAARLSRPWIQFAHFAWLKEGGEKAVIGRDGWYFYKPGLNYMLARSGAAPNQPMATNDPVRGDRGFSRSTRRPGHPAGGHARAEQGKHLSGPTTSRAEPCRGVLAPRTQDLLDRLRAANVEVIDLFKDFGEARQQTGSASPVPSTWRRTPIGRPPALTLAAKAVARRLTDIGWVTTRPGRVPRAAGPGATPGRHSPHAASPHDRTRASIPKMCPSVQVVRHDSGELYKDDAEAEILVLGDSFMRIYQQDEPERGRFHRAPGQRTQTAHDVAGQRRRRLNAGASGALRPSSVPQKQEGRPVGIRRTRHRTGPQRLEAHNIACDRD